MDNRVGARVYLDYAATTPVDPRVLAVLDFHLKNTLGNAGAISNEGVAAKKVLEESRKQIAAALSAHPDEIIFTSGGTESNNMAIQGAIAGFKIQGSRIKNKKLHAVTSVLEHSSVLQCFRELEKRGVAVTYVPVTSDGIVDLQVVKKNLRPETVLVSVQYANNEIGVIQPIRLISKIIREFNSRFMSHDLRRKTLFHTDASQAAAYLDLSVERLGVDLMTLDGHKLYGPKGVGALFVRRPFAVSAQAGLSAAFAAQAGGVTLGPIMYGGDQEKGLRPGTENVPAAVALAEALTICQKERDKESKRLSTLRDFLIRRITTRESRRVVLNGGPARRLPNNINISILDCDTEFLTLQLDAKGFTVSTKSACLGKEEGSYVVGALGGEPWRATQTLRISLGRFTNSSDIARFAGILIEILKKPSAYTSNALHQKFI